MLELYKQTVIDQFQASLRMLSDAVETCPDGLWHEPVVELKVCQVAFHALFFTDVYLGTMLSEVQAQEFHKLHAVEFGNYEEAKPVRQTQTYDKAFIREYLEHCRMKAKRVVRAETETSLAKTPGFEWLQFSRAEVHIYNIRHVHHHAAQLSLHLRRTTGAGVEWSASGWA